MAENEVTIKINAELTELMKQLQTLSGEVEKLKGATDEAGNDMKKAFSGEATTAIKNTTKAAAELDEEIKQVTVSLKNVSDPQARKNLLQYREELLKEEAAMNKVKTSTVSLIREKRALIQQMAELDRAGKKNSAEYQLLTQKAGILADALSDANRSAKNFGSDTRNTEALVGAVSGVTAAFSVYQGVTALVGKENEDLQKTMTKLFAAMAVANGVQQIANLLQKESAVVLAFNNIKEEIKLALTKKQTIATTEATAAQTGLNVASKAGISLMGAFIVAAAAALAATVYLTTKNEERTDAEKEEIAVSKEVVKSTAEKVLKLTLLRDIINDETKSEKKRKQALEDIKTETDNVVTATDLSKSSLEKLNTEVQTYIDNQFKVAAANAVLAKATDQFTKILDAQADASQFDPTWYENLFNNIVALGDTYGVASDLIITGTDKQNAAIDKASIIMNTYIAKYKELYEQILKGTKAKTIIEEETQAIDKSNISLQRRLEIIDESNDEWLKFQTQLLYLSKEEKKATQENIDGIQELEDATVVSLNNTVAIHEQTQKEITRLSEEEKLKRIEKIKEEAATWGNVIRDALGVISMFRQTTNENDLIDLNNKFAAEEELYKKQLETQVISQEQFDTKIDALNKKKAAEEKKLKHDAWEKDKIAKIVQIEIDGLLGAIAQLTGGPTGWVLAGLAEAAAIAAGIAVAAQKNPYRKGTAQILGGKSHEGGGVSLGQFGEAEGGEFLGILARNKTNKYGKGMLELFNGLNQSNSDKIMFGLNDIALKTGFENNQSLSVSLQEVPEIRDIKKLMQKQNTSITYHEGYRVEKSTGKMRIVYGR